MPDFSAPAPPQRDIDTSLDCYEFQLHDQHGLALYPCSIVPRPPVTLFANGEVCAVQGPQWLGPQSLLSACLSRHDPDRDRFCIVAFGVLGSVPHPVHSFAMRLAFTFLTLLLFRPSVDSG